MGRPPKKQIENNQQLLLTNKKQNSRTRQSINSQNSDQEENQNIQNEIKTQKVQIIQQNPQVIKKKTVEKKNSFKIEVQKNTKGKKSQKQESKMVQKSLGDYFGKNSESSIQKQNSQVKLEENDKQQSIVLDYDNILMQSQNIDNKKDIQYKEETFFRNQCQEIQQNKNSPKKTKQKQKKDEQNSENDENEKDKDYSYNVDEDLDENNQKSDEDYKDLEEEEDLEKELKKTKQKPQKKPLIKKLMKQEQIEDEDDDQESWIKNLGNDLDNQEEKQKVKQEKKDKKQPQKNQQKGKRGYKFCSGENCNELINIHKKICPHCSYQYPDKDGDTEQQDCFTDINGFKQKLCLLDRIRLIKKIITDQKIPNKYQASIYSWKKEFLFKHRFNSENKLCEELYYQQKRSFLKNQIENKENNNFQDIPQQFTQNHGKNIQLNFEVNDNQNLYGVKGNELNHELQNNQNIKLEFLEDYSYQVGYEQGNNQKPQYFQEYFLNIGHPIQSSCFSYTSKENKNQYLAVSVEINNLFDENYKTTHEQNIFCTTSLFSLQKSHLIGKQYEDKQSVCLILEIKYEEIQQNQNGNGFKLNQKKNNNTLATKKQEDSNSYYSIPNILYGFTTPGTFYSMKYAPQIINTKQNKPYGYVGGICSDGYFYIYKIQHFLEENQQKQQQQDINFNFIQQQQIYKIRINQKVVFSVFDWTVNSQGEDILIFGDQTGNIYVIKLKEQGNFEVIRFYNNVHITQITDIKFYQNQQNKNKKQSSLQKNVFDEDKQCLLFSSAGQDGIVKIFDIYGSFDSLLDLEIKGKNIQSIEWDTGGKYIVVLKEDNVFCSNQFTFFPISDKSGVPGFQVMHNIQTRLIQTQSVETHISTGQFHNSCYIINKKGQIFRSLKQTSRKFAIKRSKTKQKFDGYDSITNMGLKIISHCQYIKDNQFSVLPYQFNPTNEKQSEESILKSQQNQNKPPRKNGQFVKINKTPEVKQSKIIKIKKELSDNEDQDDEDYKESGNQNSSQDDDEEEEIEELSKSQNSNRVTRFYKNQSDVNQKQSSNQSTNNNENEKDLKMKQFFMKSSEYNNLKLQDDGYSFDIQQKILTLSCSSNDLTYLRLKNGKNMYLDHFLVTGNYSGLLHIQSIENVSQIE